MSAQSNAQSTTNPLGIPVVALVRVSTEGQAAEGRGGIARQWETINRTIVAKGLNCVERIELVDVSGTTISQNVKMREVLRRILNGELQGIVVAELDRLFRPTEPSSYAILQVFKDMGANIYAGDFEYDLTTKTGLLFSSIRSAISGFEIGLMRERQQGAKEAKRRVGKCPTNEVTLPHGIGYSRKTESWLYTPEIASVVELFRLFDEEGIQNYTELSRRTGIKLGSIKVILRNPVYTGTRVIDTRRGEAKRTSKSGKVYRVKVPRPPEDVIKFKILEGIITEECHQRVLAALSRTRYNHVQRRVELQSVYLGTGVAFCGHCGLPFYHLVGKAAKLNRSAMTGYYQCKSHYYLFRKRYGKGCKQCHLRQDELDKAIDALAVSVLSSPAHLARILKSSISLASKLIAPFAQGVVSPTQQINELRRRDGRLVDGYENGVIEVDELRSKREAIRKEIDRLSKMQKPKKPAGNSELDKVARLIVKAALRYPTITDVNQKRKIIREIFAELHIRDKAIVSFRFHDSLMRGAAEGDGVINPTILIPEPICIGHLPDVIPKGTRRCLICKAVKPVADYYRKLNHCDPCRKEREKARYLRRKGR